MKMMFLAIAVLIFIGCGEADPPIFLRAHPKNGTDIYTTTTIVVELSNPPENVSVIRGYEAKIFGEEAIRIDGGAYGFSGPSFYI